MSRFTFPWLLVSLIVLGSLLSPVPAFGAAPTTLIHLRGPLEFVESLEVPHFEVAGYVLLYPDRARLNALTGQQVVIAGVAVTEPSLYMKRTIRVKEIALLADVHTPSTGENPPSTPTIPAPPDKLLLPLPAPAPTPPPTELPPSPRERPQLPSPTPPPTEMPELPSPTPPVTVLPRPREDIALFGSGLYLLCGRLVREGTGYFVVPAPFLAVTAFQFRVDLRNWKRS